jgi:hypothetical protein
MPEKGVVNHMKTIMTENVKEKTNKTVDNAPMASGASQNNAKPNTHSTRNDTGMKGQKMSDDAKAASTHTMHNDTGMKGQKMSDEVKSGTHKSVSDPKIDGHSAGSKSHKATT